MGMKMKSFGAFVAAMSLVLAGCGGGGSEGGDGDTIKVALGDIESVETLALFLALERVRERGTKVELIELADEDLANQAVVGGQADVGLGAPYALIQGSKAPLRIFCQLAGARFFPVVDKAAYPDWQALDGETFTVHSRGSTTEALAEIVQQDEGIEFGKVSFVPGAEVRATALLRGNVKATVLDIPNKNYVMGEAPGKFHVLPTPETKASDEVLFGNTEWLKSNPESVQVLLEEVLTVWRSINEDPSYVQKERERLGLLKDLPAELEEELLPYYEQASEEGLFTDDCGGEAAAQDDFEYYGAAGQLKGEPADLKVEDFWTLDPMKKAVETVESAGN
ncbi:ABC transporter substrate-binding protein [Aeromicrobium sp.]|uniref:ABC transporter substrate-binding protein n=1 Tax=Aeromicrobium sp. TaxID=1871063 RepID=UPI003D6AA0DA